MYVIKKFTTATLLISYFISWNKEVNLIFNKYYSVLTTLVTRIYFGATFTCNS